jgi:hypothetical protein
VAGSSRNDATGTAGGADATTGDGVPPAVAPGDGSSVAPGDASGVGRGETLEAGRPVGSGRRRDAEGRGFEGLAEAGDGEIAGDGEPAADGSGVGGAGVADSGAGDSGATIRTAGASDVVLPAGSTALPRIWSRSQAEKTDAWSVVSWRAFASPTRHT